MFQNKSQRKVLSLILLLSTLSLVACKGNYATKPLISTAVATPVPDKNTDSGSGAPNVPNSETPGGGTPNIPTGGGTSGSPAPVPADAGSYKALTGYSAVGSSSDPITNQGTFKNFKDIYSPSMMAQNGRLVEDLDRPGQMMYLLDSKNYDTRSGSSLLVPKVRMYLPPGTHSLHITIYAYYDSSSQQAASFRFGKTPELSYDQVGFSVPPIFNDSHRLLQNLFLGNEWAMRVSEGLNIMPSPTAGGTIQGTSQDFYQTPEGGWLYINILKAAGDRVMSIETRVGVEKSKYEAWYNSAKWDADGNPL